MNHETMNRIRLELTGDDGGVMWKCETCDGSGQVDQRLGGPKRSGIVDCPDCTNGMVENKGRIAAAVDKFSQPRGRLGSFNTQCYEDRLRHGALTGESCENVCKWLWDNREGQPWRAALGAFVLGERAKCCVCGSDSISSHGPADDPYNACDKCESTVILEGEPGYREPAPDYDSPEGMVLLKAALRERGFGYDIGWCSMVPDLHFVGVRRSPSTTQFVGKASTEHHALFLATCALFKGEERDLVH